MSNDDRERPEGPSLEPPTLGFSMRRRRKQRQAPEPPVAPDEASAADLEATTEPTEVLPAAATGEEEATTVLPEPVNAPPAAPEPVTTPPAAPEPVTAPPTEQAPPLFADEVPAGQSQAADIAPPPARPEPATEPEPAPTDDAPRAPLLTGMAAAVFAGAFAGLLLVGATWGSLQACEAVRGTSSCGDPGFFLLLAILATLVLVGGALLRAFAVSDPISTSFLGIGLLTVIALVFLVDVLFAWWMVIVIPVCGAATFALSHWVTTTYVQPADG
ncbi:hypothetical protein [Nocardioides ferulae]|uniref:hypothetical protein n=1 Tax=Nocardioides ferulae TaxID=2340821 RepID=UPI000EAF66A9|nr:hypothetical protein [Nocardioides ferulae]